MKILKFLKSINWPSTIFIIGYHLLMIGLAPIYFLFFPFSWPLFWISFTLFYLSGLSITVGYHRYFAHQTFKTNRFIEAILLFFGTLAIQGSALRWSHDHRIHHAFIDKDEDPYTVVRGFWHAHILWIFRKQKPIQEKVVSDLRRNKLVNNQDKYYVVWIVVLNVLVTLGLGFLTGSYFGAFVIGFLGRLFFLHHFTWFINSLAHYWGHQNYSTEHTAVDNYLLSILTFGEGYHNYHHTFAQDYRNGIRWFHFDPTKWIIWLLEKCRLATGLKRANGLKISEKMLLEHKKVLLEKVCTHFAHKKEAFEAAISEHIDKLVAKAKRIHDLSKEYEKAKRQKWADTLGDLRLEIRTTKKHFQESYRAWKRFSKSVMKLQPVELPV
ncbi:MAG: hypothetical protein A3F09_01665 [Chlamydiae bacterium RIFCSPHIGHO2_12_FULL_49_11]|nr:MAG: hypothetical protein A3F09_01665 [Chlamydiae bacterium RIFCSPHIGHO2_12_FULL_49_11]